VIVQDAFDLISVLLRPCRDRTSATRSPARSGRSARRWWATRCGGRR